MVKVKNFQDDKIILVFTVEDTGIGINPEDRGKIFQSFTQANSAISRRFGGTGLGLTICKRLVEFHGGKIYVESAAGAGSVFTFELPFKTSQLTSIKKENYENISVNLSGLKVLVAEDNLMNQFLIDQIFSQWNVKIDIANNGYEVLNLLKTGFYDIILMNIQMPDLDGFETTYIIKNDPEYESFKKIPIIALTARRSSGNKRNGFPERSNRFHYKTNR